MTSYQSSLYQLESGEMCSKQTKQLSREQWWSVSIACTLLTAIGDSEDIIWKSKGLQALILPRNRLEMLPNKLAEFKRSLRLLCASYNRFNHIPSVVFELTSLLHFNMVNNQILEIPEDIRNLSCLTSLFLGNNKLRFLPDVFGSLNELLEVGFEHNYLSRLPPSFAKLHKLRKVELSHNLFTKIPDELCQLPQVELVHLESNRIQHIPQTIAGLISRCILPRLDGNPLQDSKFLALSDSEAIEYLRTRLSDNEKVRPSLRVLVIGRCGSGKTSVAKAFLSSDYVTPKRTAGHDHTVGINQHFAPFNIGGEVHEIILWDFAGEKEAAIINGIFISERTLIWLVVNLEEYTDETYTQHVGCWLDSILTRMCKPIVWIIGTHADKLSDGEVASKCSSIKAKVADSCKVAADKIDDRIEELEQQTRNCTSDLPSEASLHYNLKHLRSIQKAGPKYLKENLEVIPLTNTHSFEGFNELKKCLEQLPSIDVFQHLKDPLPSEVIDVAGSLKELSNGRLSEGKAPIVNREEVELATRRFVSNCGQANSVRKYLEEIGEIHTLPHLKPREDEIVLDLRWLINMLKYVFRHDFEHFVTKLYQDCGYFRNKLSEDALRVALDEKKTNGIIDTSLLRALWALEGVRSVRSFQSIIDMLTRFGLAYKSNRSAHSEGYLFPWLLPIDPQKSSLHEYVREPDTEYRHISVRYSFPHGCKLKGLFERFIVYCRDHVPCFNRVSRSFIEASLGDITLSAAEDDKTIDLNVHRVRCAGASPSYQDLWRVMMLLVKEMEHLLCEWKGQKIVPYVLCPRCIEAQVSKPKPIPLEYIYPGPKCWSPNSHQLVCNETPPSAGCRKAILQQEIVPPQDLMLPSDGEVLPLCVLVMRAKECYRRITEDDCLKISPKIKLKREEWPSLLEQLGWSRQEIDLTLNPIPYDSPNRASELYYVILHKWITTEGRNATVAALAEAVEITRMEHHWADAFRYLLGEA